LGFNAERAEHAETIRAGLAAASLNRPEQPVVIVA
jgi:hypothetical protein